MEDSFEIPVTYRGTEFTFNAKHIPWGYTYRFEVEINDTIIYFEPDEEGNFRALLYPSDISENNGIDFALLKSVAEVLDAALK